MPVHWDNPEGWEGISGSGTHVYPWLIHVSVWQKPLQYCKVISLQLTKINEKNTIKDNINDLKKKPIIFDLCRCFPDDLTNLRIILFFLRIILKRQEIF